MKTENRRRELIEIIETFPEKLESLVSHLRRHHLDSPWRDGGWTVRQIVHHLVDAHVNLYIRMKFVLTEDNPTLTPYNQDLWAELPDAHRSGITPSLVMLRGLHHRCADMLRNLTEKDFGRTSYHPEVGEMTLYNLMETMAEHSSHHIEQIKQLIADKGW
jgi:hypothetical protein